MTGTGAELVTNASKFVRGYDPRTGKKLWRLGGSSKITAPTPIFADDLFIVASGRAPERKSRTTVTCSRETSSVVLLDNAIV